MYYRLSVLQLDVPPLRQRKEDVIQLVEYFLNMFQNEGIPPVLAIDEKAMSVLLSADWPGNVRQLRNTIHRACVVCRTSQISVDDLAPIARTRPRNPAENYDEMRLDEVERCLILSRLRRFNGNKTAAARQLGITSRTLANKMKRYHNLGFIALDDV